MEVSMHEVIERQAELMVNNLAEQHRKVCDECFGMGWASAWYGGYPLNDPSEEACLFRCRHCSGTGWQRAE